MPKMITGYRYELEYKTFSLGIFTGQDDILGYLESDGKIDSKQWVEIKGKIYRNVEHMFEWLHCPDYHRGRYYFTEEGIRKISDYIKLLTREMEAVGVEVVKKTLEICLSETTYNDEHQFAI